MSIKSIIIAMLRVAVSENGSRRRSMFHPWARGISYVNPYWIICWDVDFLDLSDGKSTRNMGNPWGIFHVEIKSHNHWFICVQRRKNNIFRASWSMASLIIDNNKWDDSPIKNIHILQLLNYWSNSIIIEWPAGNHGKNSTPILRSWSQGQGRALRPTHALGSSALTKTGHTGQIVGESREKTAPNGRKPRGKAMVNLGGFGWIWWVLWIYDAKL